MKEKERVIVIGVTKDGDTFAACVTYKNDKQLDKDVFYRFNCDDFIIFYEENLDEIEDALDDFYAKSQTKKLPIEDQQCIRKTMCDGDFTQKEVAKNYGVSKKIIWKLCKGRGKGGEK